MRHLQGCDGDDRRGGGTHNVRLVSPRSEAGTRILFTNEAGDSMMYYADEGCPTGRTHAIPRLEEFAGPVTASVSAGAAKEESMYVVHGVRGGVAPRFHVLRFFGTPPPPADRWGVGGGWYWQSLPPPPFVSDAVISSYTVVNGGRTICVSSYAARAGTWCFDTVRGEWWHAGDWEMPFDGRAEYLADLDLWLGLSSTVAGVGSTGTLTYGELCTTSGLSLSAMAMNQPPTLLQRLYTPPENWMTAPNAKQVELINLGSGRFAIAKVFNYYDGYTSDYYDHDDDSAADQQHLAVTGVEIRPRQPRGRCDHIWSCSDGLELIHHKSISYMCECDTHRIHQVL